MMDASISETDRFLAALDACWLAGFAQLAPEHRQTLAKLQNIFSGTPLGEPLQSAVEQLRRGVYQPEHFRVLSAARASLQGAQYAHLRQAAEALIKRTTAPSPTPSALDAPTAPPPLLNGAAQWLADLAITGFSRLDARDVSAFDATLRQMRGSPEFLPLVAVLAGLSQSLIGAVPVADPASAPVFRWVDLWSRALVMTAQAPRSPVTQPTDGLLHLMGVEWRSQPQLVSAVFYGILTEGDTARWVRVTLSAHKVSAIGGDEAWLLLPQSQRLLQALDSGQTFQLAGMPLTPTGDLLWDDGLATTGAPYKVMDIARRCLLPGAATPIEVAPPLPEYRHPIHLAVPVALDGYQVSEDNTLTAGDITLPLDIRRIAGTELDPQHLRQRQHMVGLVRYDDGQFWLQPLAAADKKGRLDFIGEGGLKLFTKPPKNSTVAILQERASRLLREKK